MKSPKTVVCAGGGGVGKTTTSAALALALARQGHKTLVVTVDPARRLASAMGVSVGEEVLEAKVEPGLDGRLLALMPEPRKSTRTFIDLLFVDEPEAKERMLKNRVYLLLADAAAGMHEVVSLMLVAQAVDDHDLDYLIIDTAPSRQGLDFVSYPGRLATLYEGRAVTWLGNISRGEGDGDDEDDVRDEGGGLLAAGRKRVEKLFSRLVNAQTLRDLAGLFAELAIVKDRFAKLSRTAEDLLLGSSTRYLLVAAPSGSAAADVKFLEKKLKRHGQRPTALVLNRADVDVPSWLKELESADGLAPELQEALSAVHAEYHTRQRSGDYLTDLMRRQLPGVPPVRLPTLEARDPSRIVRELADLLDGHLRLLAGRP